MHDVGRDDHPAPGDLGPDQLGLEVLAPGDVLHLGGDLSLPRLFDLCHRLLTSSPGSRMARTEDLRSPGPALDNGRAVPDPTLVMWKASILDGRPHGGQFG